MEQEQDALRRAGDQLVHDMEAFTLEQAMEGVSEEEFLAAFEAEFARRVAMVAAELGVTHEAVQASFEAASARHGYQATEDGDPAAEAARAEERLDRAVETLIDRGDLPMVKVVQPDGTVVYRVAGSEGE